MVIKVLPEPALDEVNMMRLFLPSLPVINSKLVRSTRKASLIGFAFFSCTTMVRTSFCFRNKPNKPFLRLYDNGNSPRKGRDNDERSFLKRMVVSILLTMKTIIIGIINEIMKAIIATLVFTGLVADFPPVGGFSIFVLYAVKALESWFSSRFWSKNTYNCSLTFC